MTNIIDVVKNTIAEIGISAAYLKGPAAQKLYLEDLQKRIIADTDVNDITKIMKKLERASNVPAVIPNVVPEQGYAIRVTISGSTNQVSVEYFSSYGNGEFKPLDIDPVAKDFKGSIIEMCLAKASRALYYTMIKDESQPNTLEKFLGNTGLTLGEAVDIKADGTITFVGTTGFQPNASAIEMLDQITHNAEHGLSDNEMAFLYSGIMDHLIAKELVGQSTGLSDLTRNCIQTPGISLH